MAYLFLERSFIVYLNIDTLFVDCGALRAELLPLQVQIPFKAKPDPLVLKTKQIPAAVHRH